MREQRPVTWFDLACRFVDAKWPRLAARSRMSIADALATVTPVLVTTTRGIPGQQILRAALYGWAFNKERRASAEPDAEKAAAIAWIRANSLMVTTLDEKDRRSEVIRRALDALALTMDGNPAAATVVARKRSAFYGVLSYAVELDILPANPAGKVSWKAPETADQVDRRVVASPAQVRQLLAATAAQRPELAAFFACLYYAFLRPAEAAALALGCCGLPASGWGRLILSGSAKRVTAAWTGHGTATDRRQLKHRARDAIRVIPIPPVLVTIPRDHLERFGTAEDGRLFQVTWGQRGKGGILSTNVYGRVWQKARPDGFTGDTRSTSEPALTAMIRAKDSPRGLLNHHSTERTAWSFWPGRGSVCRPCGDRVAYVGSGHRRRVTLLVSLTTWPSRHVVRPVGLQSRWRSGAGEIIAAAAT